MYIVINIILVIISIILCVYGIKSKKKNEVNFISKHYKLIFIIILIIGLGIRIYQLDKVPVGMHVDEAGMAYDAFSIANYGVDRALNNYPIYFENFGDGQSVLYGYMAALLIKIFGYSLFIVRLPALLLSMTAIICSYLIVKRFSTKENALLFMFLIIICPWHIMQSRWGLDCNLLSSMFIISIYFLTKAETYKGYLLAGIIIGLSLYSYALSYIIIPIFLLLYISYMLYIKKINLKQVVVLGIPIFILALPLILMILVNNGYINEISTKFLTIPQLPNYRGNEISLLNIFVNLFAFTNNEQLLYNSLPQFGTIYYLSIPFLIIGIVISVKNWRLSINKKEFNIDAIMIFSFLSALICSLIMRNPNINKINAIFIPILYLVYTGVKFIIKNNKKILYIIISTYIVVFGLFSYYYFNIYPTKEQRFFESEIINLVQYLEKFDNFENKEKYIENEANQQYIYVALALLKSPYEDYDKYYHFHIPNKINDDDIYIVKNEDLKTKFIKENFSYTIYDGYYIFQK